MPSTYELELALEQQAQERERALRQAALLRAAAPQTVASRRAIAMFAAVLRLARPFGAPAVSRDWARPLRLAHRAQPSAPAADDERAA